LSSLAVALCLEAGFSDLQKFRQESLAPFVPSPPQVVEKMLEAAGVKPGETVYDLGCGDGRILITAARKYGARGVCIELSPELAERTARQVRALGLQDRIRVIQGNLLDADLRSADVVTLYLLTSSNERLKPKLESSLRRGARVVSHDFIIPGWEATRSADAGSTRSKSSTAGLRIARIPRLPGSLPN